DGIRDFHVTGVQTCALPISRRRCQRDVMGVVRFGFEKVKLREFQLGRWAARSERSQAWWRAEEVAAPSNAVQTPRSGLQPQSERSEERRVGTDWNKRWQRWY